MKHISIGEAEKQISTLVAEVEGDREVVLTRDGAPVARLVRLKHGSQPYSPEVVARRRKALEEIRAIADALDTGLTREEIKDRIREGQR